ncbi:flagellar hook-associated family protein [Polycladidibacter stylochi]|uniref:flagellar hook-associated family protein n=1 Tax=Polycladidibacter stylochi TaxID=1807766 RepID=UPI0008329478|nr:flagellar hook-associated family protein [Pseudovibrio stylochi]
MGIYNVSSLTMSTKMMDYIEFNKRKLDDLVTSTGTGKHADMANTLGASLGNDVSMHREFLYLDALKTSNSQVKMRVDVMDTSYSAMRKGAERFRADLVGLRDTKGTLKSMEKLANTELDSLLSQLNTSVGGISVFSGLNVNESPMRGFDEKVGTPAKSNRDLVNEAFDAHFGFPVTDPRVADITSAEMDTFLKGDFANLFSEANWKANWSTATDDLMTSTVSEGVSVDNTASANAKSYRDIASSYVMITAFGNIGLKSDVEKTIIDNATEKLHTGTSLIIKDQAQNGANVKRVNDMSTDLKAKMDVLNKRINSIENVSMEQIALELNNVQTQLQANYSVTSRLNQLSILNYLR